MWVKVLAAGKMGTRIGLAGSHAHLDGGIGGRRGQWSVVSERGKEVSAGKQRPRLAYAPYLPIEAIKKKYTFAKILETFCANDIRSCYHQHSLMRPFFFPIRLKPN